MFFCHKRSTNLDAEYLPGEFHGKCRNDLLSLAIPSGVLSLSRSFVPNMDLDMDRVLSHCWQNETLHVFMFSLFAPGME